MLGEHGDSQVPAWSSARAGAVPIAAFAAQVGAPITEAVRAEIGERTRNAAYTIVKGKGSTYYGIAAGLARIVGAIRQDEQAVISVSIVTADVEGVRDVALSIPRVVGREGVAADLFPNWTPTRRAALHRSATVCASCSTRWRSDEPAGGSAVTDRSSFHGLASRTATLRAGIE